MAEYYPLLAKAVATLPNSTGESRKVVYDRARKALIGQLRTLHPPVPDEDIARESEALDSAIARLEAELAAARASAPVEPAAVADVPAPGPEVPPPAAKTEETATRFPASGGALGPAAAKPFAPLRTKVPNKTPPVQAPPPVTPPAATDGEGPKAKVDPAPAVAAPDASLAKPAEPVSPVAPIATVENAPGGIERRAKPRTDQQRPIAPQPPAPKRVKRPLWIIPTGIGIVVFLVAIAAYKLRDRPETLHPRTAEQQGPGDAGTGKSVDRVGGAAAPSVIETGRTADQASPPPGGSAASQQAAQIPANANPAAPVAGRAALLVEAPEEKDKFKTYIGTAVWRLDNVSDGPNQAVGLAVRADVDLPDDKMKATVIFQKNQDASLPASHTIKIRFSVQPGSPSGNIKEINVPQMRREDSASGDPLDGVTVTIVDNSFLVGLSPGTSENANIELLRSREWIDIPIRLTSGKIAKLTFEKTAAGQRNLQEAIAAWSKP